MNVFRRTIFFYIQEKLLELPDLDLTNFQWIVADQCGEVFAFVNLPVFNVDIERWMIFDLNEYNENVRYLFDLPYKVEQAQKMLFRTSFFEKRITEASRNGSIEDMLDRDIEGMRQQGKYDKRLTSKDQALYRDRGQYYETIAKRNKELQQAHHLIDKI